MFPIEPVAFWHYFDFITISVLTIVLVLLMKSHHTKTGSLLGSISQTVAYSKRSSAIFSVTMTICFPLYYAFIWFWVLPLTQSPRWIYYLLIFSALSEMIFVWIPSTVGRSKRIHEVATGIVVMMMYLLGIFLLIDGVGIGLLARISLAIFLAYPILIGILILFKKLRRYTFVYEVSCCVLFLASMSLVAHT